MKKHLVLHLCAILMVAVCLTACEKPVIDDIVSPPDSSEFEVNFNITHFEQIPFSSTTDTRAATAASDACTRINLAIFKDGEKVKSINQTNTDSNFGTISTSLAEGIYTVVILAHS